MRTTAFIRSTAIRAAAIAALAVAPTVLADDPPPHRFGSEASWGQPLVTLGLGYSLELQFVTTKPSLSIGDTDSAHVCHYSQSPTTLLGFCGSTPLQSILESGSLLEGRMFAGYIGFHATTMLFIGFLNQLRRLDNAQ